MVRLRIRSSTGSWIRGATGGVLTRWFVVGIINAVKVSANLYEDVGHVLGSAAIAAMRSHACRTVLNNRAIAQRG